MESYESVIKRQELTDGVCSQKVSDAHLQEISRSCCSQWKSLPPYLKLETIVAEDIDKTQKEAKEKRHDFLKEWSGISHGTYKQLITALLKIKCREDAEKVCQILKQSLASQPQPTTAVQPWPPSATSNTASLASGATDSAGGNTLPELSDREIIPDELVTKSDQQEVAASLDSREESTVEVVDCLGSEAAPIAPIAPTGHTDIEEKSSLEMIDTPGPEAASIAPTGNTDVEEGRDIAPTGNTDIEEGSDASRDSVQVTDAFVDQSAESPIKLGAASQASVAGEISDTTVPIPDNTGSPWRSAEVDELPHEEVTSDPDTREARTEGVVQQRNGSLGDLSLWGRALQTRLANFLPSRAGVLAFGVGMTAFFVFFAISGYFK